MRPALRALLLAALAFVLAGRWRRRSRPPGRHAGGGQGARPSDLRRQRSAARLCPDRRRRALDRLRRRFLPRGGGGDLRRSRQCSSSGRCRATAALRSCRPAQVDLVARNAPWTMRRDTRYGANYVAASFYDGQALHGAAIARRGLGLRARQSSGSASSTTATNWRICRSSSSPTRRPTPRCCTRTARTSPWPTRRGCATRFRRRRAGSMPCAAACRIPVRHRILPERISKGRSGRWCARATTNGSRSCAGRCMR